VCGLAGLSILLIVCGLLILTSIKMDIVNIDIDKNIDRVRSAYGWLSILDNFWQCPEVNSRVWPQRVQKICWTPENRDLQYLRSLPENDEWKSPVFYCLSIHARVDTRAVWTYPFFYRDLNPDLPVVSQSPQRLLLGKMKATGKRWEAERGDNRETLARPTVHRATSWMLLINVGTYIRRYWHK